MKIDFHWDKQSETTFQNRTFWGILGHCCAYKYTYEHSIVKTPEQRGLP